MQTIGQPMRAVTPCCGWCILRHNLLIPPATNLKRAVVQEAGTTGCMRLVSGPLSALPLPVDRLPIPCFPPFPLPLTLVTHPVRPHPLAYHHHHPSTTAGPV